MKKTLALLISLSFILSATSVYKLIDTDNVLVVSADEPPVENNVTDPSAYIYWYAPSNSFGISESKTVNWSYFVPWFEDNFYWNATASPNLVDWYDADDTLSLILDWNDVNQSVKITIILNTSVAPTDLYYRVELGCKLALKEYINKSSNYEYILTLQANNTEDYEIFFNFSDVVPLIQQGKITVQHGIKNISGNEYIGFRAETVNKVQPGKEFVIDPTFGHMEGTSTGNYQNDYRGTDGSPVSDGQAENISFYGAGAGASRNIIASLYDASDNSLVGTTTQTTITTSVGWWVCDFDPPVAIYSAKTYYIAVGCDNTGFTTYYYNSSSTPATRPYQNDFGFPTMPSSCGTASTYTFRVYCSYTESANNAPTIGCVYPTNTSTGLSLNPKLWIYVNDSDVGDTLNVMWMENTSGIWVTMQNNNSLSGGTNSLNCTPTNFGTSLTKYWWKIYADDGTDNVSAIFEFTTGANDTTPPTVTVNFAGNLSDSGGPYYRPPEESTQLTGVWSDGYYTNDSKQQEDWIYINATVTDADSTVSYVWLNWINETTYTNYTYAFSQVGGYWEYNTSGNIQTGEGYNYSFDIVANDSVGNSIIYHWNKTGLGGAYTRRYVQLNCSQTNISYIPLYLFDDDETITITTDYWKLDRRKKDQGTNGAVFDTGRLSTDSLDDTVQFINCSNFVVFLYKASLCPSSFILTNIHLHIWWSTSDGSISGEYDEGVGWTKTRNRIHGADEFDENMINTYDFDSSSYKSNITYNNSVSIFNNSYHLLSETLYVTNTNFTDNDIYEFYMALDDSYFAQYPSVISNISFKSYIFFNVPDNATLNASYPDSDSDGLSDWMELYQTHTSPSLSDTDNDGVNDYNEYIAGTDPNNYSDYSNIDASVSPNSWIEGNIAVGTDIQENFTFYQNGTATVDILIGVNSTNLTFVNYTGWLSLGHDRYCANFTINNWSTESMIQPGYPATTILNSSFAPGNFSFGIRIWMPRTVSYQNRREDYLIFLTVSEST